MRIYLLIDRGEDVETHMVEDVEGLRKLTKSMSLTMYGAEDLAKELHKRVRVLVYFGSYALKEIEEGKAIYVEARPIVHKRVSKFEKLKKFVLNTVKI